MTKTDDATLIGLIGPARSGDRAAQEKLFLLCRNYLQIMARAHVESWLRAKVDISDVVQQTLLEAHKDLGRFDGRTEAEWFAWLKRILAHNAADFVRRYRGTSKRQERREVSLGRPVRGSDSAPGFDPSDPGESPSQILMRKERELAVANALALLAPDHQEVIVLRNLQRLSFNEVAERMGRTRPATQMLWMRAIRKLQDHLAQSDDSSSL